MAAAWVQFRKRGLTPAAIVARRGRVFIGGRIGLAGAILLAAGTAATAEPVDLWIHHAVIHTGNPREPEADSVVVRDGRIVYVGAENAADGRKFEAARELKLDGLTVVPGLNDAHMHLSGVGFRELAFDLEGTTGVPDLRRRLQARLAAEPGRKWLVGRGWIETHWSPSSFPTSADLDDLSPDRPVALWRADGHAVLVNSVALRLAGIDRSTPDPTGGKILREAKTGEATGMLIDNAMILVDRLIPPPTATELEKALVVGAQREVSLGFTGIQIAGHSFEEAEMVRHLVAAGKITLRVYDAVSGPGHEAAAGARTPGAAYGDGTPAARLFAEGAIVGESDGRYTRRTVKLYIDGALGSRGAALLAPYADDPSSGLLVQSEADVLPFLEEALRRGIQIETHAIGDRGNRLMLDWYEKAFAAVPPNERKVAEPRWRIEHAQVLSPADVPRFARLGIIASMQPSHAISDLYFAPKRLGPERLRGAYAWQSLLATGANFCAGSDAPVERGEPMIEFYAAVARRSLDGFANADWHPEERLTRDQALRALTLGAAYAAFEEGERGTIEVGKRADFTVLSADLMRIPEPDILKVRCRYTIVGGRIIYQGN